MEVFGIGAPELLFILLIALIVLGPKDMVKTGQRLGRMIRNLVKSPTWTAMMNTSRELRDLPTRLVRESGLEEEVSEISKLRNQVQLRDFPAQFLQDLGEEDPLADEKDINQIHPLPNQNLSPNADEPPETFPLPSNGSGQVEDNHEDGRPQGDHQVDG